MSDRTLKVAAPPMKGDDVRGWQTDLLAIYAVWKVDHPLKTDGVYGVGTRSATAEVLYGLGISASAMKDGVTPALRIKVRSVLKGGNDDQRTKAERERSGKRKKWRADLRERYGVGLHVAPPLAKIITSAHGFKAGHDGVDLICPPNATAYAICDAQVVDVRPGSWWGNNPTGDASRGDGIIQIECRTDVGPFVRGMVFGYGHAEHAVVSKGEVVRAGEPLGKAGFANAWHLHFMARGAMTASEKAQGRPSGVGTRDPMPFVRFAIEKGR